MLTVVEGKLDDRGRAPARRRPRPRRPARPRGARSPSAIGPERGGDDGRRDPPDLLAGRRSRRPGLDRRRQPQPAQVPVRVAAVVHAGDRLLADVAALREAHRPLDDPGLAGQVLRRSCRRRSAGRPLSIRSDLGGFVADDRVRACCEQCAVQRRHGRRREQEVEPDVGGGRRRRSLARASHPRVLGGGRGARRRCPASTTSPTRGPDQREDRALGACGRRSRPGGRSCTCAGRAAPPRARRPRCRATAPRAPPRGSACRPGCGPSGSAARRSSRCPGRAPHVVGDLALEELRRVGAASRRACRASERSSRPAPSRQRAVVALERRAARCVAIDSNCRRGLPSTLPAVALADDFQRDRRLASRATGPTSSSTCGSTTRTATSRRR